jgi:hypothetical protein
MKQLSISKAAGLLLLLCFATPAAGADGSEQSTPAPNAAGEQLDNTRSYINSNGDEVHSPAHTVSGRPPTGATAQCRDQTFSFSEHHRGTCSHHGGVLHWLN